MKRSIQKPDPCKRILEIEIPPQEILSIEEDVYNDIRKIAKMPGFRTGKAPLGMVKKSYQKQAGEELLRRSIPEFYEKAVAEEKLSPIEMPHVYDVNWQWGKPLVFKARFDVEPDIRLKAYKGLKIKKKKNEVKEEEIDKVLKDLQEKNAELRVVEPRPLKKGDFVLCDYKSLLADKVLESKENVWFSLEENTNLSGFADQLLGANVGETKKLNLDLPQDFPDKNLGGKKIEMEVKIKEIKEKKLPVLDDEFAKTVGQFNAISELKEGIKRDLISLKEVGAKKDIEAMAIDLLLEANKFSLPGSMVDRYTANLEHRFRQDLTRKGVKKEEIEKSNDLIKKRAREEAEKQVRIYFILERISQKENITVSDEELDKHIENLAKQLRQDFDKVKKNFSQKHLLEELRLELREEKVMSFLLQNAQIEKVE